MPADPLLVDAILNVLRVRATPEGLRVQEIRAGLEGSPAPQAIQNALEQLQRLGRVRRDDLKGRWRIPGVTSAPPPVVGLPVVADLGIPTEIDDDGVIDLSQREVIGDVVSSRQVVIAGPGFGKTAVACGRVAWLLRQSVEPARVLLLSFTRTAVREMRDRILKLAQGVRDAHGVEVRTLDSFAWRVRAGLTEVLTKGLGHDDNIGAALSALAAPTDELREYLEQFEHVLVDEAQDLVGERARFVFALISRLRPEAGWTVFLDPAQAIYEWSEDEAGSTPQKSFEDLLATLTPAPTRRVLRHLHRTQDPALRQLLLGAREFVLSSQESTRCATLRTVLTSRAPGEPILASAVAEILDPLGQSPNDLLVLVRRRAEALEVSARLTEKGVAHRLRFGSLPRVAAPWIASVLNRACEAVGGATVARADFESAWRSLEAENPWLVSGWSLEYAWRLLRRMAPGGSKSSIHLPLVAERLAGAGAPDDVSSREVGSQGLILGTIHGSKGREAPDVLFLLTSTEGEDVSEARVLYVGLSRAKAALHVRVLRSARWSYLRETGRHWRSTDGGHLQVEIGRAGDLDASRSVKVAGEHLAQQQATLSGFIGTPRAVLVETSEARQWIRCVVENAGAVPLAALSTSCEEDLRQISKANGLNRTPTRVKHLRWFDVTSVGLSADAAMKLDLPEPWNTSRLLLAPVVLGPGLIYGATK
jgi:hypothetical protein